jgi:hypothetical protein
MEQVDELRRPEARTRLMYRIVCWASGATILATLAYAISTSAMYASGSLSDVGRSFVDVDFPLPFFAQPVTYLSVASVTFFYAGLRLWQNKVAQWSQVKLASLQLFAIVVAFASAFEVVYNMMLWGSYSSVQVLYENLPANSGLLSAPIPTPWDIVFATKMFAALLLISGYSVYFLRRVHHVRGFSDSL